MKYQNPIILSDYSDPDVIRVGSYYYMISSSFNHTPVLPILKSKNLVDWKIISYIADKLPFEKFDRVHHGEGVWAPSIRYHNHKYYAVVPFPDEGIYVYEADNIEGPWSEPWCLINAKGIEDPCPIWVGDKCYLVVAFVKSRIGFNSYLAIYEVTPDLKTKLTDYKIIFDGHDIAPTVEGPKFYYINDYFYILAPCGSVKTGWQIALRSKKIYGPYEMKIILMQNDSKINGPHQGALIDLPNDKWAFIHFTDKGAYGRCVCLEPVEFIDNWPICGRINDRLLAGTAVENHDYIIDIESNYKIKDSDDFKNELSLIWQTPTNKKDGWYKVDNGLTLYCKYFDDEIENKLNLLPNLFLTKILYYSFNVKTEASLNLINNGDEAGFSYMGKDYAYISVKMIDNKKYLLLKQGSFNNEDIILEKILYEDDKIIFNMKYIEPDIYMLGYNNKYFKYKFLATPGRWIGGKYGIFAKGLKDGGSAKFSYFKVKKNERKR